MTHDPRFGQDPNGGFATGGDRYRLNQTQLPDPPPQTNQGATSPGGAPLRDQRRSRALGQDISGTMTGQVAAYDTGPDENGEESTTLTVSLKAYDFAEGAVNNLKPGALDPFAGVASAVCPTGILQSIEVITTLQFGHDGVSQKVVANLPPGQIVKAAAAGSYCRAASQLTAKYYQRFQAAAMFNLAAQYFYFDPDPNKANNIFNSMGAPAMAALAGFNPGTMPMTPIHVNGIIARGTGSIPQGGSFDRSARLTRRFSGSVPTAVAGYATGGAVVRCPIAFGGGAVSLQALGTAFTPNPAVGALSPLQFGMLDHSGNVIAAALLPNQFVAIPGGTQQIFVYNTAANPAENPFSLIFDLGL